MKNQRFKKVVGKLAAVLAAILLMTVSVFSVSASSPSYTYYNAPLYNYDATFTNPVDGYTLQWTVPESKTDIITHQGNHDVGYIIEYEITNFSVDNNGHLGVYFVSYSTSSLLGSKYYFQIEGRQSADIWQVGEWLWDDSNNCPTRDTKYLDNDMDVAIDSIKLYCSMSPLVDTDNQMLCDIWYIAYTDNTSVTSPHVYFTAPRQAFHSEIHNLSSSMTCTVSGRPTIYTVDYYHGYSVGYIDGVADEQTNKDAYVDLIGTILSMPFNILANAFSFEIFGFNLYPMILAVITIALIVFILKKLGVF